MSLRKDIEDEIRFHLEMKTRANIRAGMNPDEARADAERAFGDKELVRRAGMEILGRGRMDDPEPGLRRRNESPFRRPWTMALRWITLLREDVRYGARMLARNPFMTLAAVASLALGIGANTANFSIVHGVLFRELPFEDSDRLLFVDAWNPERGDGDAPVTWADLQALRSSDVFDGVAAFQVRSFTVTGGDRPEHIAGASVTPGLFEMLGASPERGRLFTPDEAAEAGFETVALISDGLWKRRFGGDPDIVGHPIHLNGREIVVTGVMAPGFRFPERQDLWLPLGTADPTDHARRSVIGIASLAAGAGIEAAQGVADRWTASASLDFPESHEGWTLRIQPFRNGWVDAGTRHFMVLLLAAVGFVLLLACANVANLLLARATDRSQEMAVRSAMGAGGARLAHQVLVESLILGSLGGVLGVGVAWIWVNAFGRAIPEEMTFWITVAVDRPILLYALAISVGTSLLFGLLPAVQASRAHLGTAIRATSRSVLGGKGRARSVLVVAEVALAMVLLVSASLMVRSFMALQRADPGFDDSRLLSMRIVQAGDQYDDPAARAEYWLSVSRRLGAVPGAISAVATSAIPADDGGASLRLLPEGAPEDEALFVNAVASTRGLFNTLNAPLLAGRDFTEAEVGNPHADVALIGQRLARRLWPEADPLNRQFVLADVGTFRIIGVAPDLQYEEFGEDLEGARLQIHLPYGISGNRGMAVLVRASGDPGALVGAVRAELGRIDPTLAPYDILTMPERRAFTTWEQRLFGNSFALFGTIALVLALCGIYGVIAYSVARRTREIGIRVALGARPGEVQGRVVGQALLLTGAGAAFGLVAAIAFARALRGILYGVDALAPFTFLGVLAALLTAAALASWLPAHRAAKIDPTEALRAE